MKRTLVIVLTALAFIAATMMPVHAGVDRGRPRIIGGTGASGNPAAALIAMFNGADVFVCSAAVWRPKLLLTSAHCTIDPATGAPFTRTLVFPPGSGVSYPASVQVVKAWTVPGFQYDGGGGVSPDDFAVLQLDRPLASAPFSRLATTDEMTRWSSEKAPVEHVGYGMTSPTQWTGQPMTITLPLTEFLSSSIRGPAFLTSGTVDRGLCPGDSGSPVFRHDTDATYKLLGIISGGDTPCSDTPPAESAALGFFALGYPTLLNSALAAAGYAAIPGAPEGVTLTGRNRSVVITWQPPVTAPETVMAYEVLKADGTVVCETVSTSCTVTDLPDGKYAFAVRSRNVDAEGDARPGDASTVTIAGPTRMPAPLVKVRGGSKLTFTFETLDGPSSAVVTKYTVRDSHGATVCTLVPSTDAPSANSQQCTATIRGSGTMRFTVQASTEMGPTPVSRASRPVHIG